MRRQMQMTPSTKTLNFEHDWKKFVIDFLNGLIIASINPKEIYIYILHDTQSQSQLSSLFFFFFFHGVVDFTK